MQVRVGLGYDIHPLARGRKLILGGVEIPHTQGLEGHSDADVLVHAICDALLGAMGEGDMGSLYPSSDPRYENISSLSLLEDITKLVEKKGFRLVNLDTVLIAQAPRLDPHIASMQSRLAEVLKVSREDVNVKVKSGEGLDAIGKQRALAAHAVCLIESMGTP